MAVVCDLTPSDRSRCDAIVWADAVVNYAEKLEGFQIGVLNIAKTGGIFPFMVMANWKK